MSGPLSHSHPTTPTPDGDQPQPGSGTSETAIGPLNIPSDHEPDPSDEPVYDSCLDDLNTILAATPEPDPFLDDRANSPPVVPGDSPASTKPERTRKRTSEVFHAVNTESGPAYTDSWVATAAISADPGDTMTGPFDPARAGLLSQRRTGEPDPADSGEFGSMRTAWLQLVLASYASAVTLALLWVLWTGRSIPRSESPADNDTAKAPVEVAELKPLRQARNPPLPAANLTSIGKAIRLGDLDVTPMEIHWGQVRLIRTIHPDEVREPKQHSLFLRLEFKNLGHEYAFAPLDREFVREAAARIDESYIEGTDGTRIPLFPLAAESEWGIAGEDFSPIAPGRTLETMLVSAAVDPTALSERLTWRIRLRTGIYSTTVMGVAFAKSDIKEAPPEAQ